MVRTVEGATVVALRTPIIRLTIVERHDRHMGGGRVSTYYDVRCEVCATDVPRYENGYGRTFWHLEKRSHVKCPWCGAHARLSELLHRFVAGAGTTSVPDGGGSGAA